MIMWNVVSLLEISEWEFTEPSSHKVRVEFLTKTWFCVRVLYSKMESILFSINNLFFSDALFLVKKKKKKCQTLSVDNVDFLY